MGAKLSVFAEDWLNCQEEFYKFTVRTGDSTRRVGVRQAMNQLGVSDDLLANWYVEATMHDTGSEIEPDVDLLEKIRQKPHPAECLCPRCVKRS